MLLPLPIPKRLLFGCFFFQATEDWINGDGHLEVLCLVFPIVAELLRRDQASEAYCSTSLLGLKPDDDPKTKTAHRRNIYNWIVENYKHLMAALEQEESWPSKKKLEMVKYLLLSVQSALEVFDGENVKARDYSLSLWSC